MGNHKHDLKLLEIKCQDKIMPYEWVNGKAVIKKYHCPKEATETNRVLTSGKHTLRFTFGDDFAYAFNDAAAASWNRTVNNGNNDEAFSVAVDSAKNVIVAGYTNDGSKDMFYTIKYDQNGNAQWNKSYSGGYEDRAYGVATDSSKNVIVAGYTKVSLGGDPPTYDYDYYIIKYDENGNHLWNKTINSGSDYGDFARSVAVDLNDNIIVTGYNQSGFDMTEKDDYLTIKLNSAGTIQWNKTFHAATIDEAYSVDTDASNNIIVTGSSSGLTSYTVKYDANGNQLWTANNTYPESGVANFGATANSNNDVFITDGQNRLIKYNSSGHYQWNISFAMTTPGPGAITTDTYNNIYVAGTSGTNFRTFKFDSTGTQKWNITTSVGGSDTGNGVAVDSANSVITVGRADADFYTIKYAQTSTCGIDPITSSTTLTQNYNAATEGNCVEIFGSNIVLNCAGYQLTGINQSNGIFASNVNNITIINCNIQNFTTGINFTNVLNFTINLTNITDVNRGIYIDPSGGQICNVMIVADESCEESTNSDVVVDLSECVSKKDGFVQYTDTDFGPFNKISGDKIKIKLVGNQSNKTGIKVQGNSTTNLTKVNITGADTAVHIIDNKLSTELKSFNLVGTDNGTGILIENSNQVTIDDAEISNFTTAIDASDNANLIITKATIKETKTGLNIVYVNSSNMTNLTYSGHATIFKAIARSECIRPTPRISPSIRINNSRNIALNSFSFDVDEINCTAIDIENSDSVTLHDSTISNHGTGVAVTNSTGFIIRGTTITNVETGIKAENSTINITNSNLTGNDNGTGINNSKTKLRVDDTLVEDWLYGIYISSDSTDVTVTNSKIRNMALTPEYSIYNLGAGTGSNNKCTATHGWSDTGFTNRCTIQPDFTDSPEWMLIPGLDFEKSTDLSQEPDRSSVALILSSPTVTVDWLNNVDTSYQDYDTNIYLGSNFISVNSANLDSSINTPANVEMEGIDCSSFNLYYASGFQTSSAEVISEGQLIATEENIGGNCDDSDICTNVECTDGTLSFRALHFSGFAGSNTTTLTIWDDTDTTTKYVNDDVKFYANYSNASIPITGASCNASFEIVPSGPFNMAYNATSKYYEYNRTFPATGTSDWNVTCAATDFPNLTAFDEVTISSPGGTVPEFSTVTLLFALTITVCGLIMIRRKYGK
ncbi:MAG: right-handed parallel beta-helix repeat-containing protein [Candidatus Woesearchaeota archaeon]|nr:right-handed parallel beta-helix repeat-containing protein [Candidatus Woesearchaeota archaeon]